ncbi:MAG: ComEA family DNA-binding protein [Chitinivibrionales bacterium]
MRPRRRIIYYLLIFSGVLAWVGVFAGMEEQYNSSLDVRLLKDSCFTEPLNSSGDSGSQEISDGRRGRSSPPYEEGDEEVEAANEGKRVDINTAGLDELKSLPGIGKVIAGRIIEYREEHGGFADHQSLKKVKGIGEGRLEKIRDKISF